MAPLGGAKGFLLDMVRHGTKTRGTEETSDPLRVLSDGARTGAVNMARDEALLTSVGDGSSPPTLRFYEWIVPTISLGYFQRYADYETQPPPAGDLAVVRRLTGGGAILHDRELTYSLALPIDHVLVAGKPNELYELVHHALIGCLRDQGIDARRCLETDDSGPTRGPFFCFARRHKYDVLIGSDKVAGSAQRRTRGALLQHGSITVERRFDQQPAAALGDLGVNSEWLRSRLTDALAKATNMRAESGEWTISEQRMRSKPSTRRLPGRSASHEERARQWPAVSLARAGGVWPLSRAINSSTLSLTNPPKLS